MTSLVDGAILERTLLISTQALRVRGETLCLLILQDISEYKRTKENLLEAATRQQMLWQAVDQSPATIIITDPEGTIEYVNTKFCEVTGYQPLEALGKNPRIFKSGLQSEEYYKELWTTIKAGRNWHGEFGNRRKNGDLYWESAMITPVINGRGEIQHFLAIKEDITAEKRMQAELLEAKAAAEAGSEAKSRFLANMSHEIRTPLNGILGIGHLLQNTSMTKEQHEYVNTILSSGKSLLALVNDVLDLSKIEAGKFELEQVPFAPRALLSEYSVPFAMRARAKGLRFSCEIRPEVPDVIVGDPSRVRQVLAGLTANAIKFTHTGGITVTAGVVEAIDDVVALRFGVRDTGIGIPVDRHARLFTRFEQGDASMTRRYGGSGLGLAIARELVHRMGGIIDFVSKEDSGSEFWFQIPFARTQHSTTQSVIEHATGLPPSLAPDPVASSTTDPSFMPTPGPYGEKRVLVAEDNSTNQTVIRGLLGKLGVGTVDVVGDGRAAIQALGRMEYDLVFMDVQMPELDGIRATGIIREQSSRVRQHGVPIVAVTAHAMIGDRERLLEAGMNDYISKPVDPLLLEELLRRWFGPLPEKMPHPSPAGPDASNPERDFDYQRLVERMLGDEVLAETILREFLEDMPGQIDQLAGLLSAGNSEGAISQAHGIKGASINIGAGALAEAAREIEMKGRGGDMEGMREGIPLLRRRLQHLATRIAVPGN